MVNIFTFDRHPAYLHLLSYVDADFLIQGGWETDTRPHPNNVSFINKSDIDWALNQSDVWLSHLIHPDLYFFLKRAFSGSWPEKIVQIMHGRAERVGHIESILKRKVYKVGKQATIPLLREVGKQRPTEFVFISEFVSQSWNLSGEVIYPGSVINTDSSNEARSPPALVVGNNLDRDHFDEETLEYIIQNEEVAVCGANPAYQPGYVSWSKLTELYQNSLCYLNLLQPPENSFNLATVEALSTGCPVVTTPHPHSIFTDEENALICHTPYEFTEAIQRLRDDPLLVERLSHESEHLAEELFSLDRFVGDWNRILGVSD
jgi:hypothetical protein